MTESRIDTTGWIIVNVREELIINEDRSDFSDEFREWVQIFIDNKKEVVYQLQIFAGVYRFWFVSESQAMLFKLRWGGL